jgi:DNA-binding transcriptional MerR regulator
MYTIGQISKATNVTVRTLHYYDELGLLKPSLVADTGYRYYDKDALMKLQQIAALKALGFPLSTIKELIGQDTNQPDEARWKAVIEMQVAAIAAEQARLSNLERLLRTTLNALEMTGDVQAEDIFLFIKATQEETKHKRTSWLTRNFTDEEIAILEALPNLDTDDPRTKQWVKLARDLRENMHEPPDSQIAQQLAERIMLDSLDFFQGDEALVEKYWRMIRPEPGERARVYGLDNETMDYIDAIVDWYFTHGKGSEQS